MFGKDKKEKRFIIKDEQLLGFGAIHIVVDTHTGVNYLMTQTGVTPLLDSDGKVLVDR